MNVRNNIQGSIIYGDFIAGDKNVYTIQQHRDLFDKPIFLHYLGPKISKLLWNGRDNWNSIINTTKIIALLFDNIIVSLSDLTQSPAVYNSEFFHKLLRCKIGDTYLISCTGTKTNQDLSMFLEERKEFYEKPGFYQVASMETINSFLDNIKAAAIPKRFETGKFLSQRWIEQLTLLGNDNFSINDIHENSMKNLIVANKNYFFSRKLDEIILIPDRLRGFPFVWDSINYLNLISVPFDPMSVENLEVYLATEWINCYLDNYGALIPNGLIGIKDCSFGIEKNTDLLYVISFLSQYKLIDLICALPFEKLVELKQDFAFYLRKVINDSFNGTFFVLSLLRVKEEIEKIRYSNIDCYSKIKSIIIYLYEERR